MSYYTERDFLNPIKDGELKCKEGTEKIFLIWEERGREMEIKSNIGGAIVAKKLRYQVFFNSVKIEDVLNQIKSLKVEELDMDNVATLLEVLNDRILKFMWSKKSTKEKINGCIFSAIEYLKQVKLSPVKNIYIKNLIYLNLNSELQLRYSGGSVNGTFTASIGNTKKRCFVDFTDPYLRRTTEEQIEVLDLIKKHGGVFLNQLIK